MIGQAIILTIAGGIIAMVSKSRRPRPPADTTPPALEITTPASGDAYTPTAYPTILELKGTAESTLSAVYVALLADLTYQTIYGFKTAGGIANWGSYFQINQPGRYIVRAKATDAAGNQTIKDALVVMNPVYVPPPPTWNDIYNNPTSPLFLQQKTKQQVNNPVIDSHFNPAYCVKASYVTDLEINGGFLQNASRPIDINNCTNVVSRGVSTKNSGVENQKYNYSKNVLVEDCSTEHSADNGLDVGYNQDTIVRRPKIRDVYTQNGNGIDTDHTVRCKISDVDISGVLDTKSGIIIQNSQYVEIAGGTINNCANAGITIYNNLTPSYIHDLTISAAKAPVWVSAGQTLYYERIVGTIKHASTAILINGPPPNWPLN